MTKPASLNWQAAETTASHWACAKFVGHGGSHPGYKSYFLLDPKTRTGFAVISNREDTNSYKITQNHDLN